MTESATGRALVVDPRRDRLISVELATGDRQLISGDTRGSGPALVDPIDIALDSTGDRVIVGVNRFQSDEDPPEVEGYELDEKGRARQLERLAEVKRSRSAADVHASLDQLRKAAAQESVNLMPLLIDCAKAYCTVGEMVDVLKEQWGEFQQPAVF